VVKYQMANKSVHSDAQQQVAASRRLPRAGDLRRYVALLEDA